MRRLSLGYILVLIAVAVLVPLPARADENNVCFASDPGAGNESKTAHYQWAQGKSADTLANNLAGKIAMVYNCDVVSGDQAARAFGEISSLIARRAPDARCFGGDQGAIDTSAAAHEGWARTKSRTQVRDNLAWKAGAAIRCLDVGDNRQDFFAEASAMIARVPGGATPGSAGNCNSGQYSLAGVPPTRTGGQITVNWTAPANHSERDWIAIFPEGVTPNEGANVGWQWVPKGPCGYVLLNAPGPGRYNIWLLADGGYSPIGGAVSLLVNP
jgi:hypothetical protein